MKRINDIEHYWRNQTRAQNRSERKTNWKPRGAFGKTRLWDLLVVSSDKPITAPAVFCLMENPEAVIRFVSTLAASARKGQILLVNLSQITRISPDAILLLLSTIKSKKLKKCLTIRGNEPSDAKVRAAFSQSGFYAYIAQKPKGYREDQSSALLKKHEGKRVRQDICAQLIQHATKMVYGAPSCVKS